MSVLSGHQPVRLLSAVLLVVLASLPALALAQSGEDPYRSQQWHVDRTGLPVAWQTSQGRGIVIAIVDTGVDLTHPDLEPMLLRDGEGALVGRDFVDDDDVPQDENGHGTMVAGIAAAATSNGIGVAGAAPRARLMPVRVLDEDGGGTSSDLDEGIRWAVDRGADVVNLSLEAAVSVTGGPAGDRTIRAGAAPVAAVDYAWRNGVIVVAAAGNSGNAVTDYPPTSPVLLVGATDRDDRKAGFSDAGRSDAVMAPGIDIISTWCRPAGEDRCDPDNRYGIADGTSFAAPTVSGIAALVRATGLGHDDAVERIRETARDLGREGPDSDTGYGLVDAAAAVGSGDVSPTPTGNGSGGSSPSPSPTPTRDDVVGADETTPAPAEEPSPLPSPDPATPTPSPADDTPVAEPSVSPAPDTTVGPGTPRPLADAPDDEGGSLGVRLLAAALVLGTALMVVAELHHRRVWDRR